MASQPIDPIEDQIEVEAPRRITLPYAFAKRHGVLIDDQHEDIPTLVYRPNVTNA